jgi:hypothetical protein
LFINIYTFEVNYTVVFDFYGSHLLILQSRLLILSAFWAKKQGLFDYVSGIVFENWKMVWYRYRSWPNGMV